MRIFGKNIGGKLVSFILPDLCLLKMLNDMESISNSDPLWTKQCSSSPLLSQGLKETQHPYTFISREAFIELCELAESRDKVIPLLSRIIPPVKMALVSKAGHLLPFVTIMLPLNF